MQSIILLITVVSMYQLYLFTVRILGLHRSLQLATLSGIEQDLYKFAHEKVNVNAKSKKCVTIRTQPTCIFFRSCIAVKIND